MTNIKYHYNRRPRNFLLRKVSEALPEFFTQDYPNLVTFLEKYYDYLDSDGASSFDYKLRKIYQTRDTQETSSDLLKLIIEEIAAGNTGGNFVDPNFYAQRIHELHRTKGSRFSIEEFFRAFFQQNVEVEYPKKDIFTLGHDSADPLSRIGAESGKFIRNNALYQVFSILIKSPISQSTWIELYKKFVHPAGFYIAGSVVTDVEAIGSLSAPIATADSAARVLENDVAAVLITPFTQLTALLDSDGTPVRASLDDTISKYQSLTATQIAGFYNSVEELITPNSFTFDDDVSTSGGGSNFTYNGYPRAGAGAEDSTYFAADSAGHTRQYFAGTNFDPHGGLDTVARGALASSGIISLYWNINLDSSNPIALAASALQGTPTGETFIYIDSSDYRFDPNVFVNPEHLNGFGAFNNSSNRSTKFPGLLIKGSALTPPTPEFYYRIDSDTYYIEGDSATQPGWRPGTWSYGGIGDNFFVTKLRWLGSDSTGVPDMSMSLETMDNEQFDSSFNS